MYSARQVSHSRPGLLPFVIPLQLRAFSTARQVTTRQILFENGTSGLFRYFDLVSPRSLPAVGYAEFLRDRFHGVGHDLPATPPGLEGAADDFPGW